MLRQQIKMIHYCLLAVFIISIETVSATPIEIGISLPLSGEGATYGSDYRKIYTFANEKLSNNAYRLIFEDDHCSGKDAVTIAEKLIAVKKVKYVLGLTCDSTFSSAGQIYDRSGVTVISTSANHVAGKYLFHTTPEARSFAQPLYEYVVQKHKSIGMIYEETVFAAGFANSFIEFNKSNPLKVTKESFVTSDINVRPQLLRVKQIDPEGIIVVPQSEDSLYRVVKQLHEMKWTKPVYSTFFPSAQSFLQQAGSLSEGIIFSDFPDLMSALNEEGRKIYREYINLNGEPASGPGIFPGAFEAFRALAQAIESKQLPATYLKETIFQGILGPWQFGSDGFWNGYHLIVKKIENREPLPIFP